LIVVAFRAAPYMQDAPGQPRLHGSILLFPIAREDLADTGRLRDRVKNHLARDPAIQIQQLRDPVVIFSDESSQAILPDSAAEARVPGQGLRVVFAEPSHAREMSVRAAFSASARRR
jgi:hypothetical protein